MQIVGLTPRRDRAGESLGVYRLALLPEIIRRAVRARLAGALPFADKAQKQIPSASIYFAEPLADLIGTRRSHPDRPILKITRNIYVCDGCAIIIRYASPRDLRILESHGFKKIYLLIDDDIFSLGEHDGLPADYRERLLGYRDGIFRRLLDLVTHVVAPSERILAAYRRKRALQLDPAQTHKTGALVHHNRTRHFDVVFAATRSHLQDLDHMAPALVEFLKARPDARLTTFLNGHAPRILKNLPNAIHLPMMEWGRYRRYVAENRFHAAIAPALDTDFNRARSISRLYDHAAYGAAGVYSRQPPFSGIVAHGQSGLLLPNNPPEWRDTLISLAGAREQTHALAVGGQILSQTLGDMRRVRNFWLREFNFC